MPALPRHSCLRFRRPADQTLCSDENRQTQFPSGAMTYRNTDAPDARPSHRIKTERKRNRGTNRTVTVRERISEQKMQSFAPAGYFASKIEFGVRYRNRPFSSQDVGGNGPQISAVPGHPFLCLWVARAMLSLTTEYQGRNATPQLGPVADVPEVPRC